MEQLLAYLQTPEFADFMAQTGIWIILGTILISFIALLFEIRLPIRYYWYLPGHAWRSLLQGLHILQPIATWGRCYDQKDQRPIPLAACELLDEVSHKVRMRTYTNHQGEYGFALVPGRYLLRAVKSRYRLPSVLDPENIEVVEVDESFVVSVTVLNQTIVPRIDLPMIPAKIIPEMSTWQLIGHYLRMLLFQLGNAFLALDIVLALVGFAVTKEAFYGMILAVAVALLFIKLYILETISIVGRS
jgi:hypothetical protein